MTAKDIPKATNEDLDRTSVSQVVLDRGSCLALLAPGGHGRIAATTRALPINVPVLFEMSGEDVMFTLSADQAIARSVGGSVVAFATGEAGVDGHRAWDVQITGVAAPLGHVSRRRKFRLSSAVVSGWRSTEAPVS
ncbi:MAG: hypothetical protein JWN46_1355 [Acidimicrobiales bacterium]|nr:hypothetical protein [Acidimicrobiales bacterium]